ncbi:hypothetical protein BT93_E2595 [Corymbia citriodora subsp. variegata]|nr:hypothetical protein BT93_E2595 [Corymbia citriodora subsp. variegata]
MAVEISLQESALWRHRLQRLEAMLTQDPVSCDETTTRELFTAAIRGDVDEFIRAVERFCSEHNLRLCLHVVRSPSRNSLLHVAAGLNRDDILRAIVGHFPDQLVAGKNCRGDTALHGEMRRALVRVKNDRGNTPLHEADWNGHRDVVQVLISEDLQLVYMKNKEGKCAVSLAVESGDVKVLGVLLAEPLDPSRIQGVSPVHAAVLHGKLGNMWEKSTLFELKDDRRDTPLHLAAYINYCDDIKFLLKEFTSSAVEYDRDGHFPIHVACKEGHVEAIKELLRQWPDPTELINRHRQNILHVCAKHGRIRAMRYILGNADLGKLINERDNDGNTPLHLATLPWHPVVLLDLVLDKRVDILALQTGGTLRGQATARGILATLVATVTFAAGFAVPGGFVESSEANPGTATMLKRSMFQVFVICNTIAMYSAIGVVVMLSWAQLNDFYWLLVALGTMSVAFMAGGYVLVSKLAWLGSLVLSIGAIALYHICALYLTMYVPFVVNTRYIRCIAFYIIRLGVAISRISALFPDVLQDEDSRNRVTLNVNHPATLPPSGGT